jgi:hypothetical protein
MCAVTTLSQLEQLKLEAAANGLELRVINRKSDNSVLFQWQKWWGDHAAFAFSHGFYNSFDEALQSESIIWRLATMGIKMYKTELFPYIEGDQIARAGKDVILTMKRVEVEQIPNGRGGEEDKYILYFHETPKGLVLNKTNVKKIIELVGSDDTGDWDGVKVSLYTERIKAFGEMHNATRVKHAPQNNKQPAKVESPEIKPEPTGAAHDDESEPATLYDMEPAELVDNGAYEA